jgi:hypothetical protein
MSFFELNENKKSEIIKGYFSDFNENRKKNFVDKLKVGVFFISSYVNHIESLNYY